MFILTTRSIELNKSHDLNKFEYEAYKQPWDPNLHCCTNEKDSIGIKICDGNFLKILNYLNKWKRLTSNLHIYESKIKLTKLLSEDVYIGHRIFQINAITPCSELDIINVLHDNNLFLQLDDLNQVDSFKSYEDLIKYKLCEFGMNKEYSNILINEINRKYSDVDTQYT